MNPYSTLVAAYASGLQAGKALPLGGFPHSHQPPVASDARKNKNAAQADGLIPVGAMPLVEE